MWYLSGGVPMSLYRLLKTQTLATFGLIWNKFEVNLPFHPSSSRESGEMSVIHNELIPYNPIYNC